MSCTFALISIFLYSLFLIENKQKLQLITSNFMTKLEHRYASRVEHEHLVKNEGETDHDEDETTNKPVELKETVRLEAPHINQMPELPRGCEVVSLGMLLAFHDIHIDKMELAEKVERNPAVYEVKNGETFFGNPNNGFVGDMYSFDNPGLGVYHKPIAKLAENYASNMTIYDFTGEDFNAVLEQLSLGRPVWVIINSHYKELPESEFITWQTEDGPIDITYRLHSVLVTGYDEDYIYFNDPLNYRDKADRSNFEEAWIQMGKQAITIY